MELVKTFPHVAVAPSAYFATKLISSIYASQIPIQLVVVPVSSEDFSVFLFYYIYSSLNTNIIHVFIFKNHHIIN